ncbi:ubiquinol-cytochrome c reductase iron-sulfur subunit [Embleya scabrispora]|uniref:cytochrome bc1 complex Rieske iron-sulfur subunit n=1 Tax=Embleya scabrispora TaxID=159449 RepID=UPI0004778A4F|nr:Rieske 2Fe-2S domain-containing protein [Embleya scabrispora]MYS87092.1 Rieske 2Fe-2S domain-containing protein [Streptomyces sp. SID5474]
MSSQDKSEVPEEHLPEVHASAHVPAEGDPFADPGLPAHEPRVTDIDEKAAKRAERQVAFLFVISMLSTIGFIWAYVGIDKHRIIDIFFFGKIGAQNLALGGFLGLALFCIGAGAIHWARTLMTDEEIVQERHEFTSDPETREYAIREFTQGAADSVIGRRPLIRRTMIGAMALVPLSGVVLLRDLGPLPGTKLRHTDWKPGTELINEATGLPIKPDDIVKGSLTMVLPDGLVEKYGPAGEKVELSHGWLEKAGMSAVLVVRLEPEDIKSKKELAWGYEGIVAYSKICTHVGCPIGLYEQQTHHLLCPCHQSTFDLADDGKVVFGPAARSLPQLKIHVNEAGNLAATQDFTEPVGASFWERG